MIFNYKKYSLFLFILISGLMVFSCKTDEFKFNELTVKDDFGIRIITPVFTGKDKEGHILEFRDFIHDWKKPIQNPTAPFTVLDYSQGKYKTIPTSIIFDPSVVIDSLEFLIQGNYSMKDLELIFTVSNSCPFPLNLRLLFFNWDNPNGIGAPVQPPAFPEADFNRNPVEPNKTVYTYQLDSLQTESFINSKRLKLTSWYNPTDFINQNDTIWAHYPIDISVVMLGTVQTYNEKETP